MIDVKSNPHFIHDEEGSWNPPMIIWKDGSHTNHWRPKLVTVGFGIVPCDGGALLFREDDDAYYEHVRLTTDQLRDIKSVIASTKGLFRTKGSILRPISRSAISWTLFSTSPHASIWESPFNSIIRVIGGS